MLLTLKITKQHFSIQFWSRLLNIKDWYHYEQRDGRLLFARHHELLRAEAFASELHRASQAAHVLNEP